jgi:hypothetical protein
MGDEPQSVARVPAAAAHQISIVILSHFQPPGAIKFVLCTPNFIYFALKTYSTCTAAARGKRYPYDRVGHRRAQHHRHVFRIRQIDRRLFTHDGSACCIGHRDRAEVGLETRSRRRNRPSPATVMTSQTERRPDLQRVRRHPRAMVAQSRLPTPQQHPGRKSMLENHFHEFLRIMSEQQ